MAGVDAAKVNRCIEALCEGGCRSVREVIVALESGAEVTCTAGLNGVERMAVLQELKSVMSVYDQA